MPTIPRSDFWTFILGFCLPPACFILDATHRTLQPVTTVVLSVVFLHTAVRGHEIFGGVAIAVGLLVTIYAKGLERRGSSNLLRAKQSRYGAPWLCVHRCFAAVSWGKGRRARGWFGRRGSALSLVRWFTRHRSSFQDLSFVTWMLLLNIQRM